MSGKAVHEHAAPQADGGARPTAAVPGRGTLAEPHAIAAEGSGRLPAPVLGTMQRSFGADFSDVRVHEGAEAGGVGARAYAQGNDLHFAPGEYQPGTTEGRELIGHELAHVVQQRAGRVEVPQGKGAPVNADAGLEQEANVAGAAAARGEHAGVSGSAAGLGGGAVAPMQLKTKGEEKNKKFEKGTELTEHKPGTQGAKQDYLELMDGDDGTRAGKIAALFDTRVKKSANQRFYHLQMWLMGNNAGLETAYATKTNGRQLRDDLSAHLSTAQYKYCVSCLDHGTPLLEDQVRLALGILTGSAADQKEALLLMMGSADHEVEDDDKLRAWRNLQPELQGKLGKEKFKQLETHMESLILGRKHAEQVGPITKDTHDRQHDAMLDQKDREITALAMAQKGSLSMKRDKLGEVLPAWAAKHDEETRHYVTRKSSLFSQALYNEVIRLPFGKEVMFTSADAAYAIAIVRDAGPVDDKFFQDRETNNSLPTDKAREKRTEAKAEEGAKHGEFVAYFDRKVDTKAGKKWQWGTLKEKIEEMSPEQKDWFLRSCLDPAGQKAWDAAEEDHLGRQHLRTKAITIVDQRLQDMGMKGGDKIHKGDSTRQKLLESFMYGASANTTSGGSTFQRLLSLAKEDMKGDKFGKKAVSLLRKLRGDEFAHVRAHGGLMGDLQAKSSAKYWERIQAMLGVGAGGAKDGVAGTVESDVLNETELAPVQDGKGKTHTVNKATHDLEEAREIGAQEAELVPSHWGLVLTASLKEARVLRSTEINSLVNRTYAAGKRRERLTRNGDLKLSGSRVLSPMSVQAFMEAAYDAISDGGKKVLDRHKGSKLAHAHEALRNGTRVTVDKVLDDAHYATLSLKHTSGFHASMEAITQSFEDVSGSDLLEEWSNIEEYRALKKERGRARLSHKVDEAAAITEKIRDFVVDVRADRMAMLEKDVPRAELVKTLAKLRKKLSSAAASDPEFIEALREEGVSNDEYSQQRTKNLGLLDEQRIRSTGAQYNTFLGGKTQVKAVGKTFIGSSSSSAQAKESTGVLLGHTRKAQTDLRAGKERSDVVEEHSGNIKDAQEELERRGENFDKMRKAYNKLVEGLATALVFAVAAAALGVVTVLTGGVGGAIGVAMIAGKTLLTSIVMAGVKKALNGDSFNTEKAIWDIAFKTVINTGFAAVGAFGVPALLEHLGETVQTAGDNITSTTEFAQANGAGHAAWRTALEHGLTKGAKGLFKEAVRAARDTDTNPAHRAMILLHLGSTVTQLGAKVGASSYAEYNEGLQASTTNPDSEKKASAKFNQALGKSPKAIKIGAKVLEKAIAPDAMLKGKDHGMNAEEIVTSAIAAGEMKIEQIEKGIAAAQQAGDSTADLFAQWVDVFTRVQNLQQQLDKYKEKMRGKGKDDVLDKVKTDSKDLVDNAFKLIEFLSKPEPQQPPALDPSKNAKA